MSQRLHCLACYPIMVTAAVVLLPVASWACAVCRGADDALEHGLNVSILFLVSMPFLVGGSVIGVLYVAHKRAQGQRRADIATKNSVRTQKENQP